MRTFLFVFLVFALLNCSAQKALTVKFFGLSYHPGGDPTAEVQPYKLDKNARFVMNYGAFVGYEKFIYEDLVSVKAIQGLMSDCSAGLASVSHIGIRARVFATKKHQLYVGIGPTFLVRDSWSRFGQKYSSSGYFNEDYSQALGDVQWKFVPYGFEFEYDYRCTEKDHFSISVTPAFPLAVVTSVGWKHWIEIKKYPEWKLHQPKKVKRRTLK